MKIIRIIARLNIGGPARNAVLLTEGLPQTILICGKVSESEGDMMYLAREKGIEPVIVPELGRELSFWDDWRAFWKIYKIICKEKPDIVHTHTAKAGTLGRLAGILYNLTHCSCHKVKLVHTFHGHVLHSYFGKTKTWFFIWVEKILALFTDRIIAVSESLKKELIERFNIASGSKFLVVELGFELDKLLELVPRQDSACINIGIVGRLVAVKNHKMFFRIASRIKRQRAGEKVRFTIIGEGGLRQELEDYAGELGIKDIVEFKGWVKDLREIYRDLDIVVLTSLNEGTPVSIIEAMAASRPIVATNVGGVPDIVKDGENGYLVVSNDDERFTERLLDLIKDADKRKRFGGIGRGLVRDRFLKDRLINDVGTLYNSILQKKEKI